MKHTFLPYHFSEPPKRLRKARLDNLALVPASLLKHKQIYQSIANTLPTGSVLVVPGTLRHQKIMAKVTRLFRDHGRAVITLPIEKITRAMKKTSQPQGENLPLAFWLS